MSAAAHEGERFRPGALLPVRQLVLISVYWFGINAVWGGYEWFGQTQVELLAGRDARGLTNGLIEGLGALIPILVVPTVGAISDYTTSRFGKRKGYIISGAFLDLLFMSGLALLASPEPKPWDGVAVGTPGMLALYAILFWSLQFSSNFAQGPYQGYVPDLVAEPQVGLASGAVGVMRMGGNIGGALIMMIVGAGLNLWGPALVLIGALEFILAALTFLLVDNGPPPKPREDRSWLDIAREAWGLDVLHERSFLRMTVVRFLFLMSTGLFVNISAWYLRDSLGQTENDRTLWGVASLGALAVATILAAVPAARISDRVGRKPVIWAACAVAAAGLAVIAVAPSPEIAVAGLFLMGIGSGAYLACDWALMTETIPLVTSGRFMGLANIANSLAGPVGTFIAGVFFIDRLTAAGMLELGPRAAIAAFIPALAIAGIVLIGVHPRRDPRYAEPVVAPGGDS
jgi:MFS family permease